MTQAVVAFTCNPSIWEVEAGRSGLQGCTQLQETLFWFKRKKSIGSAASQVGVRDLWVVLAFL